MPIAASPTRPKPLPLTILPASHPATIPTTKMTISPWSDRCMVLPLPFAPIRDAAPGDEQPDADGGVARRHRQNRGGKGCGYAASLGQRKRVAHIPTAEAARSGLILEGQGQARLHLKSNPPWSREWGPVQRKEGRPHGGPAKIVGMTQEIQ